MKIKGTIQFTETLAGDQEFPFAIDTSVACAKWPAHPRNNPIIEAVYLLRAYAEYPDAVVCGFCGQPNNFADDFGFWYLDPEGKHESKPCCRECAEGAPGLMAKHQAIYGVGER